MSEWRDIETAPRDAQDVLVYCADTRQQFVGSRWPDNSYQFAVWIDGTPICCRPSHWQPLPAPPHSDRR